MRKIFIVFGFCLSSMLGYSQIASPLFNDATLLTKKEVQLTLGYSAFGASGRGGWDYYMNSVDFQVGVGLAPKVNLVSRFQTWWTHGEDFGNSAYYMLSVGPELQLKPGRISLYLPVGAAYYDGIEYVDFSPTILFSIPLSKKVFFNPAAELGFTLCDGCDVTPFITIDLGLGIYPTQYLSVFLEYDFLFYTGGLGDGINYFINGGIALKIPRKK